MSTEEKSLHFIEQIIEEFSLSGFPQDKLRFRFPPEPNGYLHLATLDMFKFRFRTKVQCSCKSAFRRYKSEEQEYVDA
jgi:glutaminyl-tRNA synthetase